MKGLVVGICLLGAVLASPQTHADVSYSATGLGGGMWRYDYVISNTLLVPIDELTVFFDLGTSSDLSILKAPSAWDSIVIQPDPALPADGFFDSVALDAPLLPNESQAGFSLQFRYSGQGAPTTQIFQFLDAETLTVLREGTTIPTENGGTGGPISAPEVKAPEASVCALMIAFANLIIGRTGRRRRHP